MSTTTAIPGWPGLTLRDMMTLVRADVVEKSGEHITDAEIELWLNAGLSNFCLETRLLTTSHTFNSAAAGRTYELPSDFIRLEAAFYKGTELLQVDDLAIKKEFPNLNLPGTPQQCYIRGTREHTFALWLYPVPAEGEAGAIEIWMEQIPKKMEELDESPILPAPFDMAPVWYGCFMAHRKLRQRVESSDAIGMYERLKKEAIRLRMRPDRSLRAMTDVDGMGSPHPAVTIPTGTT